MYFSSAEPKMVVAQFLQVKMVMFFLPLLQRCICKPSNFGHSLMLSHSLDNVRALVKFLCVET